MNVCTFSHEANMSTGIGKGDEVRLKPRVIVKAIHGAEVELIFGEGGEACIGRVHIDMLDKAPRKVTGGVPRYGSHSPRPLPPFGPGTIASPISAM